MLPIISRPIPLLLLCWGITFLYILHIFESKCPHIIFIPFGLRCSPYLFDQFAQGLDYIIKCKGVCIVEHYLDDFFMCGSSNSDQCGTNLSLMT